MPVKEQVLTPETSPLPPLRFYGILFFHRQQLREHSFPKSFASNYHFLCWLFIDQLNNYFLLAQSNSTWNAIMSRLPRDRRTSSIKFNYSLLLVQFNNRVDLRD